jgi:hypothetical protein
MNNKPSMWCNGDDVEILNSIAKYVVPKSYIQFVGEDGSVFRFIFDGEKCEEKYPKIDLE